MRWKLLAAASLAGTLVLASVGSAFAGGPKGPPGGFDDLGNAQFAQSAIAVLAGQGLLNGVTPTTFAPGAPVTLGQVAAVLMRYQGRVALQSSFGEQVTAAQQAGYFQGIGAGSSPAMLATRAQTMAMIAAALGLTGPGPSAQANLLGRFHDRGKVPAWAKGSMALGVQLGLLLGNQGDLAPNGDLTRAEFAVLLLRLEQLLGTGQTAASTTVKGTYVSSGTTAAATPGGQAQQTIALSVYGGTGTQGTATQTLTVSPAAQIFLGNQTATLAAFQAGDPVTVGLDQDGEALVIVDTATTAVQMQAGTVQGSVYQVSSTSISVTASANGPGGEGPGDMQQGSLQPGTYPLSSSVQVVIGGMAGNLSNVQTGDLVQLVVQSGQVSLIIIRAQNATVTGTVERLQRDGLIVATAQGPVRVAITPSTVVTLGGQTANLGQLAVGDNVVAQGVSGEGGLVAQTVAATAGTSSGQQGAATQSGSGD